MSSLTGQLEVEARASVVFFVIREVFGDLTLVVLRVSNNDQGSLESRENPRETRVSSSSGKSRVREESSPTGEASSKVRRHSPMDRQQQA